MLWYQNLTRYGNSITYVFLLWPILLLCVLKIFWFHLAEDGEIIAPKHLGVMQDIVCINYRIVHFLVLRELFTSS